MQASGARKKEQNQFETKTQHPLFWFLWRKTSSAKSRWPINSALEDSFWQDVNCKITLTPKICTLYSCFQILSEFLQWSRSTQPWLAPSGISSQKMEPILIKEGNWVPWFYWTFSLKSHAIQWNSARSVCKCVNVWSHHLSDTFEYFRKKSHSGEGERTLTASREASSASATFPLHSNVPLIPFSSLRKGVRSQQFRNSRNMPCTCVGRMRTRSLFGIGLTIDSIRVMMPCV